MAGQGLILRVQDETGRGPFRPGFSQTWVDPMRESQPAPIYEEMEDFQREVQKWHRLGYHLGCAVRGPEGIRFWFTRTELITLRMHGFDIYRVDDPKIVFEGQSQLLIGKKHALRKLPKALMMDDIIASYPKSNEGIWANE